MLVGATTLSASGGTKVSGSKPSSTGADVSCTVTVKVVGGSGGGPVGSDSLPLSSVAVQLTVVTGPGAWNGNSEPESGVHPTTGVGSTPQTSVAVGYM